MEHETQSTAHIDPNFNEVRRMFISFSGIPMLWENPEWLDEALQLVPLDRIYQEAEDESRLFLEHAVSSGQWQEWGYQDCVARALLRWFKLSFFTWVNNPPCALCQSSTVAQKTVEPTAQERADSASRTELYKCENETCGAEERFPRYHNVTKLLQTRRGRVGEWTNCFGFFIRAIGGRVRWVWNSEDHNWLEVYSEHQARWIHADACEEAWDQPLLYTEVWGKRLAYCIAFSIDGAADVTSRYVRETHSLPRDKCSEAQLADVLAEITALRRAQRSDEDKARLAEEDEVEAEELLGLSSSARPLPQS
ncbi:Protein PNG1 [Madurella mycetomatis]|uniref:Protein PNG1 n=1 Tax=Madurella mycetomatis TaxID=100816 RepID=A0A175W7Q2_9PEZI|nr:Protein PNG1 [Madurella mycetomatis]KXX79585.1 Protein PNG1 [Madurella mycetomatis]